MTRLCAAAMKLQLPETFDKQLILEDYETNTGDVFVIYDPLHDDAQAMALVKKLLLNIKCYPDFVYEHKWIVTCTQLMSEDNEAYVKPSLNRAIVECVAKMQAAK
jgi:hypothetical protein